MGNVIKERLEALRTELRREHLSAFVLSAEGSCWISGNDKAEGIAVVTQEDVELWKKEEYPTLTAAIPAIAEWLQEQFEKRKFQSPEIGIDGMQTSTADVEALKEQMKHRGGITIRTNFDPIERVGRNTNPPVIPITLINPTEPTTQKLARIRQRLRKQHADGMLATRREDVAWTLNLQTPDETGGKATESYLLIASNKATLFVDSRRASNEVRAYLATQGVEVKEQKEISKGLKDYFEYNILVDPDEVCYTLYKKITRIVVFGESPIATMRGESS